MSEWSIAFAKYCRCKALFEPKYLRTHRTNGAKVLRCFPHCCPQHISSSVCGSSIVVRVHGPLSRLGDIVTYLHFDAAFETSLHVGDVIDESHVTADVRHETHSTGAWIACHDDVIDEKTSSRVFAFNSKRQAALGWHYRWVGGSARQQRQAFHFLRAYAFAIEASTRRLCVLAIVQSPPFIVMSYRRACKACQRQAPHDNKRCECEGIYNVARLSPVDSSRTILQPLAMPQIVCTWIWPRFIPSFPSFQRRS
ncbi:hypothetical protein LEN26_014040 [Aphanomyces euteiches]|nr:hypothetical protein LEN26_014040 [Aphanomyces euteiches]KAH9123294.1 hypothetical protein AeMF1_005671 [Aphanomyces euteiches]KAH9184693.1 hypothetical protein AeNC1_013332 [Aphanomyces euteiches]